MSRLHATAFTGAVLLHAGILLFGGLLLFHPEEKVATTEEVELLDDSAAKEPEKKEVKEVDKQEEAAAEAVESSAAAPPDLTHLPELESAPAGPALEALSLGELEAALAGDAAGGGAAFGSSLSLASGGRIGAAGEGDGSAQLDLGLSIGELDQRPRAVFQTPPSYPLELRKQKVAGSVQVVFLVDIEGRVSEPKVEKSTHPAFDRPALEAVRRWKFESGTKQGKKVPFRMRVPITFHAS